LRHRSRHFPSGEKEFRIATIIVRQATDNFLDDSERAIVDGINNNLISFTAE
jgi:chaperonin GroEL (HSP60 family)